MAREVAERRRLGEENQQLVDSKQALDLLPSPLRRLLLNRIRRKKKPDAGT